MIAVKTRMNKMPKYCEDCDYYTCRPHPYKGWTQACELLIHSMDDDESDEWIYSGEGRINMCPLIEVEE